MKYKIRDEFEFPAFKTLRLGPYGSDLPGACGCLMAKAFEVASAVVRSERDKWGVLRLLEQELESLLGYEEYRRLRLTRSNTLSSRRRAYRALERATDKVLGVEYKPETRRAT